MKKFYLQLLATILFAACSHAWRETIFNSVVCRKFHVAHASSMEADDDAISVTLWDDGGQVNCFEPRRVYTVKLTSHFHDFKGFLWKYNNTRGIFPINKFRERERFVYGICGESVSHRCGHSECNYRNLSFDVMTPKSRRNPLTFRYTVVFSALLHLENKFVEFQSCRQQAVTTPAGSQTTSTTPSESETTEYISEATPPSELDICGNPVNTVQDDSKDSDPLLINNLTSLDAEEDTAREGESPFTTLPQYLVPVNSNCGLTKVIVNESRYFEKDGIEYFCRLKSTKPIKNVICEYTCPQDDGSALFCEVKNSLERKKGFICTAVSSSVPADLAYIDEQFIVTVTNQCVCGKCPGGG